MSVRLTILVRKKEGLTNEQFHEYWSKSHPNIWLNVAIVQKNVTEYSQFHVNHPVSETLAKEHHLPMAQWDGGVNIWANTLEELMAIFQDEEYNRVVVPDEESFLQRDQAQMMIGWDEDKLVK